MNIVHRVSLVLHTYTILYYLHTHSDQMERKLKVVEQSQSMLQKENLEAKKHVLRLEGVTREKIATPEAKRDAADSRMLGLV